MKRLIRFNKARICREFGWDVSMMLFVQVHDLLGDILESGIHGNTQRKSGHSRRMEAQSLSWQTTVFQDCHSFLDARIPCHLDRTFCRNSLTYGEMCLAEQNRRIC
jgi:hypothetical protein